MSALKGASTVAPNMMTTCRNGAQNPVAHQPLPPLPSEQPCRCARPESVGGEHALTDRLPARCFPQDCPRSLGPLLAINGSGLLTLATSHEAIRCYESDSEADVRIKWTVEHPQSNNSICKCRHALLLWDFSSHQVQSPPTANTTGWMIVELLKQVDLHPS